MKLYNKIKNVNGLFYIGYFLIFSVYFLQTTMFTSFISEYCFKIVKYCGVLLLIIYVVAKKNEYNYKIRAFFWFFIITMIYITGVLFSESIDKTMLIYLIVIIAAKNFDVDHIFYMHLGYLSAGLLVTMVSAFTGIIPNLTFERDGLVRNSFGVCYPTDFAAYIFFLMLLYFYLRRNKLKLYDYFVSMCIIVMVYVCCDARLDTICMLIILIAFLLSNIIFALMDQSFLIKGITISFPMICCGISLLFSLVYTEQNNFLVHLNKILSSRLKLGHDMLAKKGVKLFGRTIEMIGYGGTTNYGVKGEYNYVDSSYVRIFLLYGVIVSVVILLVCSYIMYKSLKCKNYYLALALMIICINSIVAQHFVEFSYNVTMIIVLADFKQNNIC